jgi:hypothetical protein
MTLSRSVTLHRALLVLLAATAISFLVSPASAIGALAGWGTLVLAFIKGRLVCSTLWNCHAPWSWRLGFEGG